MSSDWLAESRFNVILACRISCQEMNTLLVNFLAPFLTLFIKFVFFTAFLIKIELNSE